MKFTMEVEQRRHCSIELLSQLSGWFFMCSRVISMKTWTEMVVETLVSFYNLKLLMAQEDFIECVLSLRHRLVRIIKPFGVVFYSLFTHKSIFTDSGFAVLYRPSLRPLSRVHTQIIYTWNGIAHLAECDQSTPLSRRYWNGGGGGGSSV